MVARRRRRPKEKAPAETGASGSRKLRRASTAPRTLILHSDVRGVERKQIIEDRGDQKLAQRLRVNFAEAGFRKQTSKRAGACVAERVDCGPELSTRNFRCGVRFVVSLPSVGRLPFEPVGRLFIGLRVGVQPFRFCALQHVDGAPNSIVNGLHFGREAKHLGVGSIGDGRDGDGDRQNGGACYE